MRDSNENINDDTVVGLPTKTKKRGTFTRCASEQTFYHLQQMEKNYSKLGDNGVKQNELNGHGRIKVHSLKNINSLNRRLSLDPETLFAGRRDVSKPNLINEREIVSHRGSVRGFKNRVRAGIATFLDQQNSISRNYRHEEKGRVIVYTTSMTVVRDSADKCKAVRNILQTHMVRYEEKDMFMSAENQKELRDRLGQSAIEVPQVFADGIHIGGYNNIHDMNESEELRQLFKGFTKIQVRSSCDKCGGYRYLPCTFCHGSKKSLHRNEFTEEFCALRCMQCDENGLVRCDDCIDQQE